MKKHILPLLLPIALFLLLILLIKNSNIIESENYIVLYLISFILSSTVYFLIILRRINYNILTNNLYIISFLLVIITPSLVSIFDLNKEDQLNEKRGLAELPTFSFSKDYSSKFETYFNDNFGLRSELIKWSAKMKIELFRATPKPDLVLMGKNEFLFYNSKNDGIQGSYTNTNLFSNQEIENAYKKQLKIKNDLNTMNILYVSGFWPNKHTIYPECLPSLMKVQIESITSLGDQITKYFKEKGLLFFDVRANLLKAKKDNQLYYKFDTHWNSNGSFEAYKAFCHQTQEILAITAYNRSDFDVSYEKIKNGDLTGMLGVDSIANQYDNSPNFRLIKGNSHFRFIESTDLPTSTITSLNETCGNNKVVLVLRDSYTSSLVQFLSLHYYKVIYVWENTMDMKLVKQTNPDIVISSSVERYLPRLLK
jgi:alginate O-acetyltransferase complex protein AlgJ